MLVCISCSVKFINKPSRSELAFTFNNHALDEVDAGLALVPSEHGDICTAHLQSVSHSLIGNFVFSKPVCKSNHAQGICN